VLVHSKDIVLFVLIIVTLVLIRLDVLDMVLTFMRHTVKTAHLELLAQPMQVVPVPHALILAILMLVKRNVFVTCGTTKYVNHLLTVFVTSPVGPCVSLVHVQLDKQHLVGVLELKTVCVCHVNLAILVSLKVPNVMLRAQGYVPLARFAIHKSPRLMPVHHVEFSMTQYVPRVPVVHLDIMYLLLVLKLKTPSVYLVKIVLKGVSIP